MAGAEIPQFQLTHKGAPPLHQPGTVVNARYEVVRQLGRGAMGEVYLVRDRQRGGEAVAMKYLLKPERKNALKRFKDEFATLAHLRHPNITAVYDLGQDESNGIHFFTTEYVTGTTFEVAAQEVPMATTMALFVQSLRALEYLHSNKILHMDIKVQNIMVQLGAGAKPSAKLIDFGIAAIGWLGKRMGTPSYMSPEVINEHVPDERSDLYSMGVALYFALTKWNPFRARNTPDTLERHRNSVPPPPSSCRPEIPEYLDRIILRLLEKDPDDRFATAAAVIDEINRLGPTAFEVETAETLGSYIPSAGPFVGRTTERDQLRAMCTPLSATISWIRGAEGMGKSRLLREAKGLAQMADFDAHIIAPDDHDTPEAVKAQLQAMHADAEHAQWIGIDDCDRLFADHRWATVVIEIRQLMQQASLHARLEATDQRAPLVVVLTSSNDARRVKDMSTVLQPDADTLQTLTLQAFTPDELAEYISTMTGLDDPPAALTQQMWQYTEGNPLFVTETLKALVRDGLLFDAHGLWKAETFEDLGIDFSRLHVPPTIEAVIAATYAAVPTEAQELLGMMATLETPATREQLQTLCGQPVAESTLDIMARKALSTFDPETHTYQCRTHAQSQAIYQQLPPSIRTQWHDRIAECLADDPDADLEQLYRHRCYGSDAAIAQAARWDLAHHVMEVHRPAEAVPLLEEIVSAALLNDNQQRGTAYRLLGKAHQRLRNYAQAIDTYRTGLGELTGKGSHYWHCELREAWGAAAMRARRYEESAHQYQQVQELLQHHEHDRARQLRIENAIAQTRMYRDAQPDTLQDVVATFRHTAAAAKTLPIDEQHQILNNDLGHALMQQRTYDEAREVLRRDVRFFAHAERTREQIRALSLVAECSRHLQDFVAADAALRQAVDLAKQARDPEQLMHLYTSVANLHSDQGQPDTAITYYERALDLCGRVSDPSRAMALTLNLGILHRQQQHTRRGESYLQSTIAFAAGSKSAGGLDSQYGCRAHLELGDHYRVDHRYGLAHQHIDAARAIAERHASCRHLLFWIVLTKVETLRDEGKHDTAKELSTRLDTLATTREHHEAADTVESTLAEMSSTTH